MEQTLLLLWIYDTVRAEYGSRICPRQECVDRNSPRLCSEEEYNSYTHRM